MNIKNLKAVSLDKFVEKAQEFYYSKLPEWLNSGLKSKFAAIDPETGNFFIGSRVVEVVREAHKIYPDKLFFIIKIGYETTCALKNFK